MKTILRSGIFALALLLVLSMAYNSVLQIVSGGDKGDSKKSEESSKPSSPSDLICTDGTAPDAEGKCANGLLPQPPNSSGATPPVEQSTSQPSTINGYPSDYVCSDGTPLTALVDMGGGQLKCANATIPQPPSGAGTAPPAGEGTSQPSTINGWPSDYVCDDGTALTALVDSGGGHMKCANLTEPHPPSGAGTAPPAGQNTNQPSTDLTGLAVRCFGDLKRGFGLIATLTGPADTQMEKAQHVASVGISLADNICTSLIRDPQNPTLISQLEQAEGQLAH